MDIQIRNILNNELARQRRGIELIASENFTSSEVMRTSGSCLTNKYAEGYPGKRYYGGCEFVDQAEQLAIDRAKELFGAEFANVQPHSGAQANAAVFLAVLKAGDPILGFDLSHGGHLSHGSPVNFSGKMFHANFYGVQKETGRIDMDQVADQAKKIRPKLIICGASAYSRDWDYEAFRQIADSCGALLLADIAHPAGLIAAKWLNDPVPHCDIITSTTHKTLRGPRGGIILMGRNKDNPWGILTKKGNPLKMSAVMNSAVFPGMQGGPLEHVIAAKAVAFGEALQPSYREYTGQVINNAKAMATALIEKGYEIISGGTDNHLMLIDLSNKKITGKDLEERLIQADITVNKNMVPFDKEAPMITSGIRIGTAAMTTRGFKEQDCVQVVDWIDRIVNNRDDIALIAKVKQEVNAYVQDFPLYPDIS